MPRSVCTPDTPTTETTSEDDMTDIHEDAPTSWAIDGRRSLDIDDVHRLVIAIGGGEIDVIGRDEPGAHIEVRSVSGLPLEARLEGGVLRVGALHGLAPGTKASITVSVHREAAVQLETVTGEVLVSGVKRGFRVRTVSGGVLCDATAGHAQLEGTSGELALREHEGPVEVTTVSGAATASGAITRFECDAVSGDVFLDLESVERVEVRTVSGQIVLRLAPDRPADYVINTISGRLEIDGQDVGRARGGFRGGWGEPGPEPVRVRMDTASGTVRVVHSGDGPTGDR